VDVVCSLLQRKYLEDVLLYVGESRSFCARAEDLAHSTSDSQSLCLKFLVLFISFILLVCIVMFKPFIISRHSQGLF